MANTVRGRKLNYDNIAAGSATGIERTINGAAPPAEAVGGKDNIAAGSAFPTTIIPDNQQAGVVTMIGERLG